MNSLASQLRNRFSKLRRLSLALLAAGAVLFGLGLALSSPPNDFAQGFPEKVLRPVLASQDLQLSRSNVVVEPSLPVRESLRWGLLIIALAAASIALGLKRLTRLHLWFDPDCRNPII